jgi:hypothetical protein
MFRIVGRDATLKIHISPFSKSQVFGFIRFL